MKHVVVGHLGEVGSAIYSILKKSGCDVCGIDKQKADGMARKNDVMHICIPCGKGATSAFVVTVVEYVSRYLSSNGLLIVHSTVPVGTCDCLNAVHSPIRGKHPNLEGGVRAFVKFFGGARAEEAAEIFSALGIKSVCTSDARNTEAMKLLDTTYYGWNIIFEKAVHEYCERHGLDFNVVYTEANRSYNVGYDELGLPDVRRPVLGHHQGRIGGHCVRQNAELMCAADDDDFAPARILIDLDEKYGK